LQLIFIMSKKATDKIQKRLYGPLLIIGLTVYVFLVVGYQKGFIPEILFPTSFMKYQRSLSFNPYGDENIRYGIILAPIILLFAGIIAAKNRILWSVAVLFIVIQIFSNASGTSQLFQYSFHALWNYPYFPSI